MKKAILVLAMCVSCSSIACDAYQSAPIEDLSADECREELKIERELSESCGEARDDCENGFLMGEGETVELDPVETLETTTPVSSDDSDISNLKSQIASLTAENSRQAILHKQEMQAEKERYNGLLNEFRDVQDKYGKVAATLANIDGKCLIDDAWIWGTVEGD